MKKYRSLTAKEITQLEIQECICQDWSTIEICDGFSLNMIRKTVFLGKNRLGLPDSACAPTASIFNSVLNNCTIGNEAFVMNVPHFSHYEIGEQAYINNVNCLSVESETAFGNGVQVSVLDETGSRSLPIYTSLSAQIAYLLVWYKFEEKAIENLQKLIADETKKQTSTVGKIGRSAHIVNCGSIINTQIGDFALLRRVSLLQNGSILSTEKAPTEIGTNVIARDFIVASGSKVIDGAQLERCFVGQNCELAKGFSAIDSLFFANSQGFHGEAVSVFAAPFTVTHHKATLLIGGMFSFFNAGSGSNQSNHMYKLGPIHYGVLDRGCKMASDSYLPCPSRVGTFSVIMGKHKNKIDTSDFPFSYLIADGYETIVIPALMLQSIGTYRDASKWKSRDGRKENPLDIISFDLLNPYTVSQILKGLERLKNNDIAFSDKKISIKKSAIQRAINLYEMALNIYLGNVVNKRMKNKSTEINGDVYTHWTDCAGMIVPNEKLLKLFASKNIHSIADFQQQINNIYAEYEELEWNFAAQLCQKQAIHFDTVLEHWETAKKQLKTLLIADTEKEYSDVVKVNFGLNQSPEIKEKEFEILRGKIEDNAFLQSIVGA